MESQTLGLRWAPFGGMTSAHRLPMCGVFGIYGHSEAANLTYLGLHALQHRGQESAGIATSNGKQLTLHRGMGQVIDVFSSEQLSRLQGRNAIGHVRYSTSGGSFLKNAQPIAVDYAHGQIALAHNGNLTNADELRQHLEASGSIFYSASDTEVVVHLLALSSQRTTEDRIADALVHVKGAFSLLFLTESKMIAVRDPFAIRPLCLGQMSDGSAYVVSSEPSSFALIEAKYVRDVEPGEMIVIDERGLTSSFPFKTVSSRRCIFEYVYFARPDSTLDGVNVYEARKELGRALADAERVDADVVVPVPDSAIPATLGFAERASIPFEMGLVRSNYVGRTFIEPQQSIRHFGVRLKHSPVPEILRGKRVIVVDDSIVRGTTSRKIVKMIRDAGAKEVHLRIASPPTRWPCHYGIDTPTRDELIAATQDIEAINRYITSDSLAYLSREAMVAAIDRARRSQSRDDALPRGPGPVGGRSEAAGGPPLQGSVRKRNARLRVLQTEDHGYCHACFSGEYPIEYRQRPRSKQMRLLNL